jgi:hypothetical protein
MTSASGPEGFGFGIATTSCEKNVRLKKSETKVSSIQQKFSQNIFPTQKSSVHFSETNFCPVFFGGKRFGKVFLKIDDIY